MHNVWRPQPAPVARRLSCSTAASTAAVSSLLQGAPGIAWGHFDQDVKFRIALALGRDCHKRVGRIRENFAFLGRRLHSLFEQAVQEILDETVLWAQLEKWFVRFELARLAHGSSHFAQGGRRWNDDICLKRTSKLLTANLSLFVATRSTLSCAAE